MSCVDPELGAFWEARDPLSLYHDYLLREGGFGEAELTRLDDECSATLDDEVAYAQKRPFPAKESVTDRVFAP